MDSLLRYFQREFNNQQEQWENSLKAELKLTDIHSKAMKSHLELSAWPILSLKTEAKTHLAGPSLWKKASQTYFKIPEALELSLNEDLDCGARNFFFHKDFLNPILWEKIQQTLSKFNHSHELNIFLLGETPWEQNKTSLKIFDENHMLVARRCHEEGGHNLQELALLTLQLIEQFEQKSEFNIGLYVDGHFFKNIAKIRAMRLLASKVQKEKGLDKPICIIALTSLREWTLFERYSNILRNDVSVASALMGGADQVQSCGYQLLFESETTQSDLMHEERSRRLARNTSHILTLESMLGMVADPAYGSDHLEALTEAYARGGWELMQKYFPLSVPERAENLSQAVKAVKEKRKSLIQTRKDILVGINDFPDYHERLNLSERPVAKSFRAARDFEELRLRVENLKVKPQVHIKLFGDYGELNNRIHFIKNYFELLGLEVFDPIEKSIPSEKDILVLCALDADYSQLVEASRDQKCWAKYLAGKGVFPGITSLHAGQDIYQVLSDLVLRLEGL